MSTSPITAPRTGPVVIGYDGSSIADRAVAEAAGLLAPHPTLVVVVWEAGLGFEAAWPVGLDAPVPPMDLRTALALDEAAAEAAAGTARKGAALARSAGLQAEGLVVADDVTVAATLVRVARERDARALVVGAHRHGALSEVVLGSTSRDVLRHAHCPVLVVRGDASASA